MWTFNIDILNSGIHMSIRLVTRLFIGNKKDRHQGREDQHLNVTTNDKHVQRLCISIDGERKKERGRGREKAEQKLNVCI